MQNFIIILCCCLTAQFSFSQISDSSQYYFNKGIDENNAKLYAVAAKDFERAIQLNPDFTDAYIANGKANLEMRKILWLA